MDWTHYKEYPQITQITQILFFFSLCSPRSLRFTFEEK